MNKETYEALKEVIKSARQYASKMNEKKRKSQQEVYNQAVLYRDIVKLEGWINEVAKEYEE